MKISEKSRVLGLLMLMGASCVCKSQDGGAMLNRLYSDQFDAFYNGDYTLAMSKYDTITFLASGASKASVQIAVRSLDELIKVAPDKTSMREQREYLQALLRLFESREEQTEQAIAQRQEPLTDVEKFRRNYDLLTLRFKGNERVLRNGDMMPMKEVYEELQRFETSKESFDVFKKKNNISGILLIGTGIGYLGALIASGNNEEAAIGLFAGGLALNLIAIPFSIQARTKLKEAVWDYNREVAIGGVDGM